uniref:Uncharacterized protein n=1 Tax=Magallana gigas TaxID=29159 RepID=K1QEB4_MAGGI
MSDLSRLATNITLPAVVTSSLHDFLHFTSNLTDSTTTDIQTGAKTTGSANNESRVNEAFDMALSAIIIAAFVATGIELRYLLRRYRDFILKRERRPTQPTRPRPTAHATELTSFQEQTLKKEPVTPHRMNDHL